MCALCEGQDVVGFHSGPRLSPIVELQILILAKFLFPIMMFSSFSNPHGEDIMAGMQFRAVEEYHNLLYNIRQKIKE